MLLSRRIALGGMMTAVGVVLLAIASFMPTARLALAGFAGVSIAVMVIADGVAAGTAVWVATSVIGTLLFAQKGAVAAYAIVLGVYPIVKSLAERTRSRLLMWTIKILAFNALFTVLMLVYSAVVYDVLGGFEMYVIYAIANAVFVVYDIGFSSIIAVLINRFGSHLKRG